MPITMYNKKTGKNVKVYGFVQADAGMYGGRGHTYAVTYQLNDLDVRTAKLAAVANDIQYEATADDLVLTLVPADQLRPLEA